MRIKYHRAVEPDITEPVLRSMERKASVSGVKNVKIFEYDLFSSMTTAPCQLLSSLNWAKIAISQYGRSLALISLVNLSRTCQPGFQQRDIGATFARKEFA